MPTESDPPLPVRSRNLINYSITIATWTKWYTIFLMFDPIYFGYFAKFSQPPCIPYPPASLFDSRLFAVVQNRARNSEATFIAATMYPTSRIVLGSD